MKKVSSYYAGQKVGEKIFYDNLTNCKDADTFIRRTEKAKITCAEYCSNMSLDRTKSGIKLTKKKREFYRGMYDFLTRPQYSGFYD